MFDAQSFCQDYGVPTAPSYSKHVRSGWVNIACPFCAGNPGWHGGFNTTKGYYHCWRCGGHWLPKIISALTNRPTHETRGIIAKYTSGDDAPDFVERKYAQELKTPGSISPLTLPHRRYLASRGYDPDEISATWEVGSTGRLGRYKNRIYIPIHKDNQVISYTTRYPGTTENKYKACSEEDEVYHHKFSIYGVDQISGDTALIVEGPTDVWRIGPGAGALFGDQFTMPQVRTLVKRFKRVFILMDPDDAGQEAAPKLSDLLLLYNVDAEILVDDAGNDPGDMSGDDIQHLRKEIGI